MDPYYSTDELAAFGFRSLGKNVRISRKSSIYGAPNIRIGNHVRIDDFSVLTAREEMILGHYVHISCLTFLHGYRSIHIGDFAQVSSRVGIYTSSADCSGETFTNPLLLPDQTGKPEEGPIVLGRYSIIGTGSTVLEKVTLGEGCVLGANSFTKKSLASWSIYAGNPACLIKQRKREIVLQQGQKILEENT